MISNKHILKIWSCDMIVLMDNELYCDIIEWSVLWLIMIIR